MFNMFNDTLHLHAILNIALLNFVSFVFSTKSCFGSKVGNNSTARDQALHIHSFSFGPHPLCSLSSSLLCLYIQRFVHMLHTEETENGLTPLENSLTDNTLQWLSSNKICPCPLAQTATHQSSIKYGVNNL